MLKYNIDVPISGSILFLNIEATSEMHAINLCHRLYDAGKGERQERVLWSKAETSEQALPPPKIPREPRPSGARTVIDWSKYDHLIGKISDNKIAKMAGCSTPAIKQRRKKLGYPPVQGKAVIDWTEYDKHLGLVYDQVLAKIIDCDRSAVALRRKALGIPAYRDDGIDWAKWDKHLGTEPDSDLARKIGCNARSVTLRRELLERLG